ncbi:YHYH protein [Roseibacillus persicicus]|uniref:YHYH protein n=1 Tax=Roseibacillus persicicus TaxID=454148 RepID=UPI00398AFC5F
MKTKHLKITLCAATLVGLSAPAIAQDANGPHPPGRRGPGGGGPGGSGRIYSETESKPLELIPADQEAPFESQVSIKIEGDSRIISSNVVPEHKIGKFPNAGNPNTMTEQKADITLPLKPEMNDQATPARTAVGILLNGVYVEAGTGEFWTGEDGKSRPWNYEALGGAINFGLDENYAHVQPGGKYHYHGKPAGYLEGIEFSTETHSPIIGWAFDGFPIYALYGYSDPKDPESELVEMTSSYRLKKGERPEPPNGPGGTYDGAFTDDYEYVEGSGNLDECNGRFTVTPDFPEGTYAYFITNKWPVILRNYRGTPAVKGPGGGGGPGQGGPGGRRMGPPRGERN